MPKFPLPKFYTNEPPPCPFVDSLFSNDVRGYLGVRINSAIEADKRRAWLIDKGELETIVRCWQYGWWSSYYSDDDVLPDIRPMTHRLDNELMSFIQQYVNEYQLTMHVPRLADVGRQGSLPVYELGGYDAYDLHGGPMATFAAVSRFLKLLAAGAHFVFIHARDDVPDPEDAPAPFFDAFELDTNWATFHSHYRSGMSPNNLKSAKIYPTVVSGDTTPKDCPFVLALLFGRTAHSFSGTNYNTFLQLEGWPASGIYSSRHMADYNAHQRTKWNISTFGACPYSEKRGATVFLAPPGWEPTPDRDTIMAPYRGAGTRQKWLETNLITLP